MVLISLDIDGTLEVGDPPGILTMDMVRAARRKGHLVGSCSDRPLSTQRAIFHRHDIALDFAVSKHILPQVMATLGAEPSQVFSRASQARNSGITSSEKICAGSLVSRPKNSITNIVQPRSMCCWMASMHCSGVPVIASGPFGSPM